MQEKKCWLIQTNRIKINTNGWEDQKSSAWSYSLLREKYHSLAACNFNNRVYTIPNPYP